MFCTVYPGWLQEQREDKAAAFFGGLGLGGAEQCGILLTFHVSSMHSVPPNRPESISDSSWTNFIHALLLISEHGKKSKSSVRKLGYFSQWLVVGMLD